MKVGAERKRKCSYIKSCNQGMDNNQTAEFGSHYGFVSYFGETVRQMKAVNGSASITKEVRREIAKEYKNLAAETKAKYKVKVERTVDGETTKKYFTRCAPERLATAVANLSGEQKAAVCEMGLGSVLQLNSGRLKRKLCGWLVDRIDTARCVLVLNGNEVELSASNFGHIMGIKDGGMPIQLEGDTKEVELYLQMFSTSSRGINIKNLAEILSKSTLSDDRFKVTFMLFALCTVLCPPGGVHISAGFLFSLKDVNCIQKRNWASFCFQRFIQGISRYKEENLAYIGGCLLYLELLYFNCILYEKVKRDRSMCPLGLWNADEIKRLMKWIDNKGGYGSNQIQVRSASMITRTTDWDGCTRPSERLCDVAESADMGTGNEMIKINWVTKMGTPVSKSARATRSVDRLKTICSCCSYHVNNASGKACSDIAKGERRSNHYESGELFDKNACGCMEIDKENARDLVSEDAEQIDLIRDVENVIGFGASEPLDERMQSNGRIQVPPVMQKYCEPSKRLSAAAVCTQIPGGIANRELTVSKICPERGRYRVGPYIMPRPFGADEERLIKFCMDENLDKGEILFQTNMIGISRNDILSLSPRSSISVKIVSAVSELLSAQAMNGKVGHSSFSLYLPPHNANHVNEDHIIQFQNNVCEDYRDLDLPISQFVRASLFVKNFGCFSKPFERIYVPVNHGEAQWYMLVAVIPEHRVEIWEALPTAKSEDYIIANCKRMLRSIEMMFNHGPTIIPPSDAKLPNFRVEFCTRSPSVLTEYDSALYVLLMMERYKMWSTLSEAEVKFHSDAERARIVVELITSPLNGLKDSVRSRAEMYQNCIDAAERNMCQAIQKRRLQNLRRTRRMGHGPRR